MLMSADALILQHVLRLLDIYVDCSYIVWFSYGIYGVIIMSTQLR
jgi:translation initiation factor RLI1